MRCTKLALALLLLGTANAWANGSMTPASAPVTKSTLYDYRNTIEIQDDFLAGINSNGNVGTLGWGITGGNTTYKASESNRLGIINRDSSATISTLTRLDLAIVTSSMIDPALSHYVHLEARLNDNDADTQMRLGSMASSGSITPVNGIYFEKLGADTNWFCVTRQASTQTRVDSGIAVNTSFHGFRYTRTSAGIQFSIDGVNVCGVMTTNIPSTFLDPALQLTNNVAAAKTYDVDYFEMKIEGITR